MTERKRISEMSEKELQAELDELFGVLKLGDATTAMAERIGALRVALAIIQEAK